MLYSIGWYDPQEGLHFVEQFDNGSDGDFVQHTDSMRKAGFVLDGVEAHDGLDVDYGYSSLLLLGEGA